MQPGSKKDQSNTLRMERGLHHHGNVDPCNPKSGTLQGQNKLKRDM